MKSKVIYRQSTLWIAAILIILGLPFCFADEGSEGAMIDVLHSNAPAMEKAAACERLKQIGTEKAVPALGELLASDELSHCARYALEPMPYPEAGKALLDALEKTKGSTRVGVINSLGVRRETLAVPALCEILANRDESEARAAADALGKIGGPDSQKALLEAMPKFTGAIHKTLANALLQCAEALLADGQQEQAATLYDRIFSESTSSPARVAAFQGSILATGRKSVNRIAQALDDADPRLRRMAAQLVRANPGTQTTLLYSKRLEELKPPEQIRLLYALADRGDVTAQPPIQVACKSNDENVRIAALQALGLLGNAQSVSLLAQHAADVPTGVEHAAAADALVALRGEGINEQMVALLDSGDTNARIALIEALEQRHFLAATPALFRSARDTNRDVRMAALRALRNHAQPEDIAAVITLLLEAAPDEKQEAERVLIAVTRLLPPGEKRTAAVLTSLNVTENPQVQVRLMDALGKIADPSGLKALRDALASANPSVQTAAIRALAAWPDATPMASLLELAQNSNDETQRLLALRGFLSMAASTSGLTPEKRLENLKTGLGLAKRNEEKKQALAGIANVHLLEAFQIVQPFLDEPALRDEAATALCSIGEAIQTRNAAAVKPIMEKMIASEDFASVRDRARNVLESIQQLENYLVDWEVSGPYTQEGKQCTDLFDIPFAPEQPDGKAVWRQLPASTDPAQPWYLDLLKALDGGEQRVAYLRTELKSNGQKEVTLEIGSDDGVKVWLNGQVVHANNTLRPITPGSDKVRVALHDGSNTLMLKVTQNNLPWGASVRVGGN